MQLTTEPLTHAAKTNKSEKESKQTTVEGFTTSVLVTTRQKINKETEDLNMINQLDPTDSYPTAAKRIYSP